ncbi:3D domain-containing protein [Effusibacillus dendaii]|uniref:LysM domain-containing protein n=1 Tax=Effusibacillus dendaii TaxID=2743772 RepID=A0A7I8DET9_9BACL|nr:3D domain-containing protein [Effusibacillus dendaii]BCJ86421.1 hypothetical protein skT53_14060 [Effusibacillus dendaii]
MDIPIWRIALLTAVTLVSLSSNPHAVAKAPKTRLSAATATTPSCVMYQVQESDNVWKILRRFTIDFDQLKLVNPQLDTGHLQPGQHLKIPMGRNLPDAIQPTMATQDRQAISRSGKTFRFNKKLDCTLTAYTAGPESTGKRPGDPGYGITFCGKRAAEGRTVAVDPQTIPIGSQLYIEGIGFRTAEDTGGAVKGSHIDVFFEDINTAIQFGRQKGIPVYVLETSN